MPKVFDNEDEQFSDARAELRGLLSKDQWSAAAKTTLNAHYTDAGYAQAIWDMLTRAGLPDRARVLEPGCGAGTFLGLAPTGKQLSLLGVELDPTTAAIAGYLYPDATVRAESFADTRLPNGSMDLVIGNVPFGKIQLHDKTHNPSGHSLHNHFIIKSLHLTRPGGVVAVLTSHYTMDSANPAARREIAQLADLVTAIRLPISAHQKSAGTQVITDLLVLRRREPAHGPGDGSAWESTTRIGGDQQRDVLVNTYFAEHHPENIIGTTGTRTGPWGPELDVRAAADIDITAELRRGLDNVTATDSLRFAPATVERAAAPLHLAPPAINQQDHIALAEDGTFLIVDDGALVPHQIPATQTKELTALLGLRDVTIALLAAEATNAEDTEQIADLRRDLNTRYDSYLAKYGPINRITWRRTGRVDEVTGEDRLARISPPQGKFRLDPHSPAVYALEDFDATTGTARKAPIFTGRVVAPRTPRLGADTPADAVAICLDTHGEVRLGEVARLLGRSVEDARDQLTGLVFADPDNPTRLIPAPEYLSGNVRQKLAAAEAAADRDCDTSAGARQWDANITALREVLPVDLTPAEIDARLGASWIEADIVQQFLRELLDTDGIDVEHPGGSTWAVKATPAARHSVLATATYGTARLSAVDIAHTLLEQRQVRIYDELDDGRRVPNLTETVAAQEKAGELAERFSEWIWDEPQRATTLAARYNEMFNSIVLRSYDGTHMQLPGLAVTFKPRDHQLAAVARTVSEPAVLLAHEVGAGKTAEMVIAAQELRRLGMAKKPCVVVPNHMLEQFSREWMQLYPQARILAASIDDLARDKRRRLVARIATGDWDAVIVSRSAFERVPLSLPAQKAYLDSQLDDMRRQLEASKGGRGLTVKRLEGALARAEERIKKLTDSAKDPGITFEETGIDYLFVDEAHGYKNLNNVSNIPGAAVEGAQRASDLDMKLAYLRGRHGGRVATFATATPIANSVSEAFTMQRYLRPDLLQAAGLTDFDTWAATFGEVTTDLELAPDGSRFRMQARFAKFRNVPELLRMWHVSADIKTAEDLNLPTPALRAGKAETVVVPATDELADFMAELSHRADLVQSRAVDRFEDNMLKVSTHGRMAALDLRLLGRDPGPDSKLAIAADRIAATYHANRDRTYEDSEVPGALQIVFCDLQNSLKGIEPSWNVYDELKHLLTDRGLPADTIRFVHEARNDKEKGELFAAARNGRVSVLIGSTEKMGVGTNVQKRAIALHHLDCPWRPADIAQREGRILRQGNLNPEVEVIRYVTEHSFDSYLWQTVERKARFIGQVMRGRLDVREIEDVGDTALSYAEVKALATGDPRILEKAKVDAEVTRLERLERAHTRNQRALSTTITNAETELPTLHDQHAAALSAADRALDISGVKFHATINGTRWTSRADAAIALRNALAAIGTPDRMPYDAWDRPHHVATIAGFDVHATPRRFLDPHLSLALAGVPRSSFDVDFAELRADRPLGIITRLENRTTDIARTAARIQTQIDGLTAEADRARHQYGQPFAHRHALDSARHRSAELAEELAATDTPAGTPANPPAAVAPHAGEPAPAPPATQRQSTAAPMTGSVRDWTAQPPRTPEDHQQWARDQAIATYAARTPITAMDTPSVQRELRHVHADPTVYRTAHEARAALTATRASLTPQQPAAAATDPRAEQTPRWNSVQTYPIGTRLTVHSAGPDGPGHQLGHGTVVDHPGPDSVVVESPWGTRRTAALSHVRPLDPAPSPAPAHDTPGRSRWTALLKATHPAITDDPAWPALLARIELIDAKGHDVPALIANVLRERALPDDHPARSLDYRLSDAAPEVARSTLRQHPYRHTDTQPATPPPPMSVNTPPRNTPPR